jgi:hypothetical protein
MKKFVLSLGLILMLIGSGWQGDFRSGISPARAEHPRAPGRYYCDPYYNRCTYNNYYSAPYTDPLTQYFYYSVPHWGGRIGRHRHSDHPRRQFEHPRRRY